ncbi:hypothetical protein YC2023_072658 [Brassica napus]
MIYDPMKIVVSCAVFEVESPIPPDRSMHFSSYIGPTSIDATTSPSIDTGRVSEQKKFDVCGNLRDGKTTTRSDKSGEKKNWKKRKMIKDSSQFSLIPRFSDGVRKSRMRSRCISHPFAKLRALLLAEMIDNTTQITLRSVTLIKRGSDVVLRDRIHKELGNN